MGELANKIGMSQYHEKEAMNAVQAIREILMKDLDAVHKCLEIDETLKNYDWFKA